MSASGYTPISLYYSTTALAVPLNTNLANGELAINITDGTLYYKDNSGVVKLLAANSITTPVTTITFGTTGLTPATVTSGAVAVAGTLVGANGGTGVNNGSSTITIGGNVTMSGAYTFTGTLSANTSVTFPTTGTLVNSAVATLSSLASVGTITTGTWNATIIGATYGGTGVNNGSNTITLGGNVSTAGAFTTSGAFGLTLTTTALTSVTLPTSGTLTTLAGTETLSNKNIQARVVNTATAASITINADTTDVATMANTEIAGTFTINAPSGTPTNGQKLIFRLSSTAVQTFSWNAIFQGSTDVALPTASSSGGKYDYMGFIYNSINSKWQMVASNFGF